MLTTYMKNKECLAQNQLKIQNYEIPLKLDRYIPRYVYNTRYPILIIILTNLIYGYLKQ